jgi:glycerol-3-phosphate dehydrogenase
MSVNDLLKSNGKITGVIATDLESGEVVEVQTHCVINAAGPFCDAIRQLDDANCPPMIAPSQGVHVVLPRSFFPGSAAMIVPKTTDGRVIFIIPWYEHAIIGTTDTAIEAVTLEPKPRAEEVDFLLETASIYLKQTPTRTDILSVFTGIRPLVKGDKSARTASLSRDHVIRISPSGLVTITGGKWTTVRKMAEDCVDQAIKHAGLKASDCQTKNLRLHGFTPQTSADPCGFYGSDLAAVQQLETEHSDYAKLLHPELTIRVSAIVWAVRQEMARTVEDVLARRTRALFLNAQASLEIAPQVASIMARELGKSELWCAVEVKRFAQVAEHFLPPQVDPSGDKA